MYANRHKPRGIARTIKLAALWTLIGSAVAGIGATAFIMQSRPPSAFSLCERGTEIEDSTLILIDTTDAFSETHKDRLRTTIEGERDRLARGAKFSVLIVNADAADAPIEIVSTCNPGRGDDVNPIFTTASRTEKQWQEQFAAPIEAAIGKANENSSAEQSPIIQTIAAVLTRPDFDRRVLRRRLVIVSDMLEHGRDYSQLTGEFSDGYQRSNLDRLAPLDLHGTAVAVDYLQRPAFAAIQGAEHRAFWKGLFVQTGADDVSFVGMADQLLPDATGSIELLAAAKPDIKPATTVPPKKKKQKVKPSKPRGRKK